MVFIRKNKFQDIKQENIKLNNNDAVSLTFRLQNVCFNVVTFYRKPSSSRIAFLKDMKQFLLKTELNKMNVVLLGDFNFNLLKLTQDVSEKHDIEKFENLLAKQGYELLINSPTREEIRLNKVVKSCLDPIFTNLTEYQNKAYVVKIKLADHYFSVVEIWKAGPVLPGGQGGQLPPQNLFWGAKF